jgi:molybdopterin-guanine dinucleotide biosynthesis protein A
LYSDIEGVILAGGESKRMGQNKSLVKFNNKFLINHVYERLAPQVSKIWISTNVPIGLYPESIQFKDLINNHLGPLGGIHAGLFHSTKNWVQFCPNDCPFIPKNLVSILSAKINERKPKIIVPTIENKLEPVFILCPRSVIENLEVFIKNGERKIDTWIQKNDFELVEFKNTNAFININDQKELKKNETKI